MTIEGEYGSFKVSIETEGEWDTSERQWKYQVRQTDGKLYGKLVGENDLQRSEK